MAWAIGAAIGGAFGQKQMLDDEPDAEILPHVCITGDGAYLMSGQEITVAAQYQLPVVIIVLNDAALGMIRHGQQLSGAESIGWEINEINYAKMAEGMGITGIEVRDPTHFDGLDLSSIFDLKGPVLVDVKIDPDEVPPMGSRVKTLAGETNAKATGYK
jgi:acetolactate synthase-1/2/3 large subunit